MKIKKILISSFVVLAISVYAVYQRFGGGSDEVKKLTLPTTTTNQTQTQTSATSTKTAGLYKDGQYTGPSVDVFYGNVKVVAVIQNGKISDVKFLEYPKDRSTSREISSQAMPLLTTEAIAAQSAKVDIISGATQTSEGFRTSLAAALALAK